MIREYFREMFGPYFFLFLLVCIAAYIPLKIVFASWLPMVGFVIGWTMSDKVRQANKEYWEEKREGDD